MNDYDDFSYNDSYDSGPYCRHYGDPGTCLICEELCLNCGHRNRDHDNNLEDGADRDQLICTVSFNECTNPNKSEACFDDEGFCICSEFVSLDD